MPAQQNNSSNTGAENKVLLAADNVAYVIRDKTILTDISLQLHSKEIITLIGPNGAGKTSLIKILLGLSHQTSGEVVRDHDLRIGYVPQRVDIPKVMPIRVCDFLNVTGQHDIEHCEQMLEEVSCAYLLYSPMQELSGGEMQRVLLARALLKKPQLLVLDEPASGMDIIGQQGLYDTIRHIRDKHDCGILMVSHDLHLVMAATDRVICLNSHICCTGHPDDVSEHPEYLKLFGDAVEGLALYSHHHDHEHDLSGNIVESEHCHSCEHHQDNR
ncbi:MAG: ATP-binding cassette domain-containing protein [Gammaproteobacteria bacterium]|nr:ATP-binding cassette domain-containing protein [Gammaproteobacteria bacterium]MBT8134962.1 ATP-binding cassette domain-containing protein [Gammaproteobacteria bacterium]NNJ51464.1 ATP-binding cassette domain-containing protein [Gammaproteobacteria bacterium]